MKLVVEDGLVSEVTLYRAYPLFMRWDVLPFALAYAVALYLALTEDQTRFDTIQMRYTYDVNSADASVYFPDVSYKKLLGCVLTPVLMLVHMMVFFMAQSSVAFRCKLGHKQVGSIAEATIAYVKAAKTVGNDRIAAIGRLPISGRLSIASQPFTVAGEFFEFQKVMYNYDASAGSFVRLSYPTRAPIVDLLAHGGHGTQRDVVMSAIKWGRWAITHIPTAILQLHMHFTAY